MYATKYNKLTKQALRNRDHNMCSVLAVALTCKTTYKKSHALHDNYGRKHRCGTYWFTTEQAIKALGFKMVACHRKYLRTDGRGMTINNTCHQLQRGYYLVLVDRHVLAVHNGTVHDWSKGSKRRIKGIWKIERVTK